MSNAEPGTCQEHLRQNQTSVWNTYSRARHLSGTLERFLRIPPPPRNHPLPSEFWLFFTWPPSPYLLDVINVWSLKDLLNLVQQTVLLVGTLIILYHIKGGLVHWLVWCRSSHRRCSVKKGVLRNFAKFTGKHLYQSLYFNKVAGPRLQAFVKEKFHQGEFNDGRETQVIVTFRKGVKDFHDQITDIIKAKK